MTLSDRIDTDPLTGADVRALREHLKMTRVEFGRAIDAPVQPDRYDCRTVQRWESGESKPGEGYAQRIRLLARAELTN